MGRFTLVQLDPGIDLLRELGRVAQRHRDLVGGERKVLDEMLGGLLPAAKLPHRPADLPDIGAARKNRSASRRTRAKDDPRVSPGPVSLATRPRRCVGRLSHLFWVASEEAATTSTSSCAIAPCFCARAVTSNGFRLAGETSSTN